MQPASFFLDSSPLLLSALRRSFILLRAHFRDNHNQSVKELDLPVKSFLCPIHCGSSFINPFFFVSSHTVFGFAEQSHHHITQKIMLNLSLFVLFSTSLLVSASPIGQQARGHSIPLSKRSETPLVDSDGVINWHAADVRLPIRHYLKVPC